MRLPRLAKLTIKAALTAAAFALLLTHPVAIEGERLSVWQAVRAHARPLAWSHVLPWLGLAALTKAAGIGCAIARWRALLAAQALPHAWGQVTRTFLIGRFLGTFLPGTLGLDGTKLLAAGRTQVPGAGAAAVAATLIEKVLGLCGILVTFLIAAPLGAAILGEATAPVLALCVPVALSCCLGTAATLIWPAPILGRLQVLAGRLRRAALGTRLAAVAAAAARLGRQPGRVAWLMALSFGVHFATAALYFFTALAVDAHDVHFFEVVFASSIQILATVLSPLTIAGEGVREAVQALLLARRIGLGESILSAALGFWAAEALTLVGAYFWWREGALSPAAPAASAASGASADQVGDGPQLTGREVCSKSL